MKSETPRVVGPNVSFALELPGDALAGSRPSRRRRRRSKPVRGVGIRFRSPFGKGWITI